MRRTSTACAASRGAWCATGSAPTTWSRRRSSTRSPAWAPCATTPRSAPGRTACSTPRTSTGWPPIGGSGRSTRSRAPRAPPPTPADRLHEQQELGAGLAAAIDALPDDQREAVWLVDVEGMAFAEVAAVLGVAQGTVASRVARGRASLRVTLAALAAGRRGWGR
ncbi:MAG: sigma factor-like helix-turn-helix DNA-binding protein [Myxococcota bacterium]